MGRKIALVRVPGDALGAHLRAMHIVDQVHGKSIDWLETQPEMRSDTAIESFTGLTPFKLGGGFPRDSLIYVESFEDQPGTCLIYFRFRLGATALQAFTMGISPKMEAGANEVLQRLGGELLQSDGRLVGF